MSIWVKICGNTSLEDAWLAAEAGADAVGFVFAPSPRRVTAEQVASLTPRLPDALEKIGVFVDTPLDEIEETVRSCGLSGVQLHAEGGAELPSQLRKRLGPGLRILRVVHFGAGSEEQAAALAQDNNIDAVLVDSRTATAVGGTGIAFDWDLAAGSIFGTANAQRYIAAGGLTPDNVADAIARLNPWGVDVVSGVEAAPGRKDPDKVRIFIAKARAAALARASGHSFVAPRRSPAM
jgi:phosphoribosylanthranilate isomerase